MKNLFLLIFINSDTFFYFYLNSQHYSDKDNQCLLPNILNINSFPIENLNSIDFVNLSNKAQVFSILINNLNLSCHNFINRDKFCTDYIYGFFYYNNKRHHLEL